MGRANTALPVESFYGYLHALKTFFAFFVNPTLLFFFDSLYCSLAELYTERTNISSCEMTGKL